MAEVDLLSSNEPPRGAVLSELGDVLEVGCLVVDRDLRIREWNHWLEVATRKRADEVIGCLITEVFAEEEGHRAALLFTRALGGESLVLAHRFHEYFLPMAAPPGLHGFARMQQSARIVPFSENGRITGAVALIQDVSERVSRERDLNDAREKAEAASKAKSEFLAAISHELRTPLTAILGYSDLLESEIAGPMNPAQQDQLQRIIAGTWHLIKIIDEILSFSRMEASKYEVSLEKVNAGDIVGQAVALLEPQVQKKGIRLDVHMPNIPLILYTDALKVRQIILNIVGNAVKFTDSGTVSIEVREASGWLYIVVADTGPGIPARFQHAIFEPFVQVDQSNTRQKGGTGLGLPLSRGLAELLGGDLTLVKSDSSGTTFELRLPTTRP